MKRLPFITILILLVVVSGVWCYYFGYRQASDYMSEQLSECYADYTYWVLEAQYQKEQAEHYKFWLDKMTFDNRRAKEDIEWLSKVVRELKEERDVYYTELHKLLNEEEW